MAKTSTKKSPVKVTVKWVCPSCKNRVRTDFCPRCGETRPGANDLKIKGLFGQFIQAFVSVDGRLIKTLQYLIARPGVLTTAYMQGRRVPYIGPFQLFLIANVLFFAMQSLTNTHIVSSTLDSHLSVQDWSGVASDLAAARLKQRGISLASYAPVFDQAVIFYGKTLIILMTVPFMVLLWAASPRRRPVVTHVVFSLHFYSFLLLLFSVSLLIAEVSLLVGGRGLSSEMLDKGLTFLNLIICSVYLYAAIGVVYGARTFTRPLKALVLGASVTGILLGYRFVLFLITLYTT